MKDRESISRNELLEALKEAQEQIQHLENGIAEYKWLDRALRKRTFDLSERVKELECLYAISSRLANTEDSLDKILTDIIDMMPRGWQYPKLTCVQLKLNDFDYHTSNFLKTRLNQTTSIFKGHKKIGTLEVCLLPSPIHDKHQPFLPQEKQLLEVIAIWIGLIIECSKRRSA